MHTALCVNFNNKLRFSGSQQAYILVVLWAVHVLLSRLLVQRHIARSITLIGCRSIQIQEAFCPLQIKTMGEVADSFALAKWSGNVRLIS